MQDTREEQRLQKSQEESESPDTLDKGSLQESYEPLAWKFWRLKGVMAW